MIARRALLAGLPAVGLALAAIPLPAQAETVPSGHPVVSDQDAQLLKFLKTAGPADLAMYHAMRLAEAMNRFRSGNYFVKVDHDLGVAMVIDHDWKKEQEGPLLADDVTGTDDFAKWQRRQNAVARAVRP